MCDDIFMENQRYVCLPYGCAVVSRDVALAVIVIA